MVLVTEIRPRIGAGKRAGKRTFAAGRDASRSGVVDDRSVTIVCHDRIIPRAAGPVVSGAVLEDQVAGRTDVDAAIVARHVVVFYAIVACDDVYAGPVAAKAISHTDIGNDTGIA